MSVKNKRAQDVYLTLVGGGAFANNMAHIICAIKSAIKQYSHYSINIIIIDYQRVLSGDKIKMIIQ